MIEIASIASADVRNEAFDLDLELVEFVFSVAPDHALKILASVDLLVRAARTQGRLEALETQT